MLAYLGCKLRLISHRISGLLTGNVFGEHLNKRTHSNEGYCRGRESSYKENRREDRTGRTLMEVQLDVDWQPQGLRVLFHPEIRP